MLATYVHKHSLSDDSYQEAIRVHGLVHRLYNKVVGKIYKAFTCFGGSAVPGGSFPDVRVTISTLDESADSKIQTEYLKGKPGRIEISAPPLTEEQIYRILTLQPE